MPQTVTEYLEEVGRGTTSGRLSPFIHPFMHCFNFRNVVSEEKKKKTMIYKLRASTKV